MIISCPSCQAQFKVDATRLATDGTKVRCSKCGHVWRTMPDGQPVSTIEQLAPTAPQASESAAAVPAEEVLRDNKAPERIEPVLSVRDDIGEGVDDDREQEESAGEHAEAASIEDEAATAAGLTGEQRAKLTAVRQKRQPGGARFWIYVLLVFIVVAGILMVAMKMNLLPQIDPGKTSLSVEKPADVGEVDAKPAPADPANSGHIIGGEEPAKPAE